MPIDQQLMQVMQCSYGNSRFAENHRRTCRGIEHPHRHQLDYATVRLHVNDRASASMLYISDFDATPV